MSALRSIGRLLWALLWIPLSAFLLFFSLIGAVFSVCLLWIGFSPFLPPSDRFLAGASDAFDRLQKAVEEKKYPEVPIREASEKAE